MVRALIDTGAIFAMIARGDSHHGAASGFLRTWLSQGGVFVLADLVFAETMTLTKGRLGAQVAIRIGRELRQNPAYHWAALGPDGERDTWAAFQQYDDKDWSYTDCALLVLGRRLKIPDIFAFDRHFTQMPGVKRLP